MTFNFLYQSNVSEFFAPMFRVTLGARGFFFLLFAAKIERQSRDHHDRCFAAQCSPQTTRKKPSCTQGTLGSEAPTKKYKNAGRRERYPGVPETFLARFPVSVKSRLRCSWLRPSANTENSRRTREKPLVPRVRERLLFAQTKGGKMLHVAYRD